LYKNKYLKYKAKYLELSGGISQTPEELELEEARLEWEKSIKARVEASFPQAREIRHTYEIKPNKLEL